MIRDKMVAMAISVVRRYMRDERGDLRNLVKVLGSLRVDELEKVWSAVKGRGNHLVAAQKISQKAHEGIRGRLTMQKKRPVKRKGEEI